MTKLSPLTKEIEKMAEEAHASIPDTKECLALKWEYIAAYKEGASALLPDIRMAMEALSFANGAPIFRCDCTVDSFGDRNACPSCMVKSTIESALAKLEKYRETGL